MMKISQSLMCCVVGFGLTTSVLAEDWPTWRGPNADSISKETIKDSGEIAWKTELGAGCSGVAVKDGKLITAGNIDNVDYIYCLDPITGKEIWKYSQPTDKGKVYAGPLGTPITDGKKVWFCNRFGLLICLDFATGKKLWEQDLHAKTGGQPKWHYSSSVVLLGDLALLSMGKSGVAVNKETGELVWASQGSSAHTSPTIMHYDGKDYVIIHSGKFVCVVDPKDGKVLAEVDYPQSEDITGSSPVIIDAEKGQFFVASAYNTGRAILFEFDGKALKQLWEVKHFQCQFATPVLHDGVLYGTHGRSNARKALRAIDAKTGELLWTGTLRFGTPMIAGDKLVFLDERCGLHFLNIDKTKEDIISSHEIFDSGKCWQMPTLANGYLYCRTEKGTLAAVKVH